MDKKKRIIEILENILMLKIDIEKEIKEIRGCAIDLEKKMKEMMGVKENE